MKMHLLVLEFVALYIHGVQLCEPYCPQYCFTKSVLCEPMDMDRVVVVKAQDDMEIDNDPMEVDNDL